MIEFTQSDSVADELPQAIARSHAEVRLLLPCT
jgi:hypothetical protein